MRGSFSSRSFASFNQSQWKQTQSSMDFFMNRSVKREINILFLLTKSICYEATKKRKYIVIIEEMYFTRSSNTMLAHRQCSLPGHKVLSFIASRFKILIAISIKLTGYTKDASNCFLINIFLHSFRLVIQLFLVNIPRLTPRSTSWLLYDFSLMRETTNQALGCKYDSKM